MALLSCYDRLTATVVVRRSSCSQWVLYPFCATGICDTHYHWSNRSRRRSVWTSTYDDGISHPEFQSNVPILTSDDLITTDATTLETTIETTLETTMETTAETTMETTKLTTEPAVQSTIEETTTTTEQVTTEVTSPESTAAADHPAPCDSTTLVSNCLNLKIIFPLIILTTLLHLYLSYDPFTPKFFPSDRVRTENRSHWVLLIGFIINPFKIWAVWTGHIKLNAKHSKIIEFFNYFGLVGRRWRNWVEIIEYQLFFRIFERVSQKQFLRLLFLRLPLREI